MYFLMRQVSAVYASVLMGYDPSRNIRIIRLYMVSYYSTCKGSAACRVVLYCVFLVFQCVSSVVSIVSFV